MGKKCPVVRWVKGERCKPFEYLCSDCHELHLSYVKTETCTNCGSANIVKGKLGTLERSRDNDLEGKDEGLGRR